MEELDEYIKELLKNNPTFDDDILYYCSSDNNVNFLGKSNNVAFLDKKAKQKRYQRKYYMEVTKKKRQLERFRISREDG